MGLSFMLPGTAVSTDTSTLTEGEDQEFGFIPGLEDTPPGLGPGPIPGKLHIRFFLVPTVIPDSACCKVVVFCTQDSLPDLPPREFMALPAYKPSRAQNPLLAILSLCNSHRGSL